MKITKIVAQVKNKGRYSIFVDDAYAFGISELGLIDAKLRIGLELDKAGLELLKIDAAADKTYNQVLGLLARRPRSEWEIRDYLKRKATDEHLADQIVERLRARGYVDDLDFARRWIESRRLLKPTSSRKLEQELRVKRVQDVAIKQALSQDETDEFEVLLAEVEKKRRQSRYQDDTKLMQYLARQGYQYEDIKRALSGDAG